MRKYLSLGVKSSILSNIRKTFFGKYKFFRSGFVLFFGLENLPPVLKYKKFFSENYQKILNVRISFSFLDKI